MDTPDFLNRRRSNRLRVNFLAEELAAGAGAYRVRNLSECGAFIDTESPMPEGTRLLISFILPDGQNIASWARVMWQRRVSSPADGEISGMGVRFEAMNAGDFARLFGFVRSGAVVAAR